MFSELAVATDRYSYTFQYPQYLAIAIAIVVCCYGDATCKQTLSSGHMGCFLSHMTYYHKS